MKFLKPSLVLSALLLAVQSVVACPDCALKSSGGLIEPQTMTAKMAFSSSTLLLLAVFFSVVSFMIWIMVKTCRELNQEPHLSSSPNS